ncbi:MAG: serine/threonine protein kinase, partial [Planctomycetes bacterium]|nr:serine/threonine protein kinase [Planctomycetota bacterium]
AIVAVVIRAARALHAAHRTGLIHRDVKPANVLVTRGDDGSLQPILVDFGLARELGTEGSATTTTISGTPAYMAPEQARGEPLDRRVDVYALGAVLYELLSGDPPVRAPNLALALREVVEVEPVPLRARDRSIPRELETIVACCLEKDPGRRYATARDLADDLQRYLDG